MSTFLRRAVAAPVVAFTLASAAFAATAAPALADNSSTLTVVGTSDVYDSNLVQSVIKPGFEQAYPGVTLNYVSKGTGAAIAYAEQGSASAMIVHAASLENQFVGSGYSLENYGRAIFWGDYVLAGPKNSDPAKVLQGGQHDIVTAFQRVAASGAKGKADFVSRGGTPGTTVQEHALWALSSGVPTCDVSEANGGGEAPSTTTGACPANPANPNWYHTTGLTQGPNIVNADTCNYGHGADCYVFTDRGTFQYLQSTGQAQNLRIMTVGNSKPGAAGGLEALVNSFHAYAVNPAAFSDPNVQAGINTTAATNFLNYLTSVPTQTAIGAYLSNAQGGAPFIPSAAPSISSNYSPPSPVAAGATLKVSGTVKNVVPGAPALNGVTVRLNFTPSVGGAVQQVATAVTNDAGKYTLTYKPTANGTYTVASDAIDKIEKPDLTPPFGDKLAAGSTPASGVVTVQGAVKATFTGGQGTISGTATIAPKDLYQAGSLVLYGASDGGTLQPLSAPVTIPVNTTKLPFRFDNIPPGTYQVEVHYRNDNVVVEGVSTPTATVTVS